MTRALNVEMVRFVKMNRIEFDDDIFCELARGKALEYLRRLYLELGKSGKRIV